MRVRVLQHVPHEGPGAIAEWAEARGHELSVTRFDRGEAAPGPDAFDALVVMGGPMSANDESKYSWITPEKHLIEAAIQHDRRVLGVCLGAQLIASALGYRVFAAPEAEIGWLPVRTRPEAARSRAFAEMPASFTPLHWHAETFDLPQGALHLAETDACPHQAFEIEFDGGPARGGALVLALQFHLEATETTVRGMIEADGASLACVPGAPRPEGLLANPALWAATRPLLDQVLDRLTAPAAPPPR
ncbi:MAG TPA: type 1 glutamine amidotransferase [Acidobacteriota bacterium]|nr:type 1 glutamine amidotransferase [Acidobacteriota bacterium]